MTERFFIVTEKSPLYKDYFLWIENEKITRKFACDFAKRHGLPVLFSYDNTTFSIIVGEIKSNQFENQLKKLCTWTEAGKLYEFKKNSVIGKAWVNELKSANLKVVGRPLVLMYFSDCFGRWGWNMFECGGNLYLKTTSENEPDVPDGMTGIRGSEFYKAKEDYDAQKEGES